MIRTRQWTGPAAVSCCVPRFIRDPTAAVSPDPRDHSVVINREMKCVQLAVLFVLVAAALGCSYIPKTDQEDYCFADYGIVYTYYVILIKLVYLLI